MTTIALTREEICADSCFSFDGAGTDMFTTDKLYRIGVAIFGEAGDSAVTAKIIKWLQRGADSEREPAFTDDERAAGAAVVELAPDGIFLWDTALMRLPVKEPNFAIGSGRKVALFCMRFLDMTPFEAVQSASLVCAYTKPPFTSWRL